MSWYHFIKTKFVAPMSTTVTPLPDFLGFVVRDVRYQIISGILIAALIITLQFFKRRKAKLSPLLGEWAIVTGATDGIGKALAMVLAERGFKMLLISRSLERLKETESELRSSIKFNEPPTVKVLVADFSMVDSIYETLREEIAPLDVGVLINNVGASYPHPMFYEELESNFIDMLINVNLRSTMHMTSIVLQGMTKRKRGAIICVGSGASQLPCNPMLSLYTGVKAGIESFCRSLQAELYDKNIVVQCQVPLLVTSKLSKIRRSSISVPSAKKYASDALAYMDKAVATKNSVTVCPYWFHRLQLFLLRRSRTFVTFIMKRTNKHIRSRALKKKVHL